MTALEKICPDARGAVLIPENHTRNQFYLQNVAALQTILRHAGMNVRIGSLLPDITAPTDIELAERRQAHARAARAPRQPRSRSTASIRASCCSTTTCRRACPRSCTNLEQAVLPPLHAGWTVRRKSNHFAGLPRGRRGIRASCSASTRGSSIRISRSAAGSISRTARARSASRATSRRSSTTSARSTGNTASRSEPFVIVKADAGTYGMGIMTVKDPSEVRGLNRKQRNKMAVVKEGLEVHDVIVQEGVYTFETRERRGRRAGRLHDRPLRRRRLLPRAHRARQGREPERARACSSRRSPSPRRAPRPIPTIPAARPTASTPTASSRASRCSPPRSSSSVLRR